MGFLGHIANIIDAVVPEGHLKQKLKILILVVIQERFVLPVNEPGGAPRAEPPDTREEVVVQVTFGSDGSQERGENGQDSRCHPGISVAQIPEIPNDCGAGEVLGRCRGASPATGGLHGSLLDPVCSGDGALVKERRERRAEEWRRARDLKPIR